MAKENTNAVTIQQINYQLIFLRRHSWIITETLTSSWQIRHPLSEAVLLLKSPVPASVAVSPPVPLKFFKKFRIIEETEINELP